jgi:hypothetical protein
MGKGLLQLNVPPVDQSEHGRWEKMSSKEMNRRLKEKMKERGIGQLMYRRKTRKEAGLE